MNKRRKQRLNARKRETQHPGAYVREYVIPKGMSVKDAASVLGIGRPALSNFLNGNSSLSPGMATRLEKAFGSDRKQLLELQAAYDRNAKSANENTLAVRAFVPTFLTIKARQIEDWAGRIDARSHFPVLIRKLVYSSGNDLVRVDFPGYDNSQRQGSDGFVESSNATPWIPEGRTYWELGTNQAPAIKAENDYASRLISVDPEERADGTFIFVTPRNWPGKVS